MFEIGLEYFKFHAGNSTGIYKAITTSKLMWNWWKNQYIKLDNELILKDEELSVELYRAHHLGLDYYPNRRLIKAAMEEYEKAIQELLIPSEKRSIEQLNNI